MSHMFPELEQELSSAGADLEADLYPTFGSQSHALSVSSITGIFIFTRTDIINLVDRTPCTFFNTLFSF